VIQIRQDWGFLRFTPASARPVSETSPVSITFRIPGIWSDPGELFERLPPDYRLTDKGMVLPDGSSIEAWPVPPDDQFSKVFLSVCRQPPTPEELDTINRYTANIILVGEGGSGRLAHRMMRAATAILEAGGAGVFIDNSALSHGGSYWRHLTEDGSSDAISFAFVSIVQGKNSIKTTGMHVLGYPELELASDGDPAHKESLISVIRYISSGEKPVGHGHLIVDENGFSFCATRSASDRFRPGNPMHNPFGQLKLIPTKEIAEGN
jgi:hypothetical protein